MIVIVTVTVAAVTTTFDDPTRTALRIDTELAGGTKPTQTTA